MIGKAAVVMVFAAVIALAAWACGGDDDSTEVTDNADLTVVAENTKFSPGSISVPSGEEITLELQNRDAFQHDLQVDGLDVDVIAGGPDRPEHDRGGHGDAGVLAVHTAGDETMSITFVANDPGAYEFYCTIPGHKESGMVGKLNVK